MNRIDPTELNPAERELFDIRKRFTERRLVGSELTDVPELLWHYTSSEGLLGILASGSLWASHILYLNDAQEAVYGMELADSILERKLREMTNPLIKDWLQWGFWGLRASLEIDDTYIVCFSSEGKLLGQWRAYAAEGKGFSVGFNPQQLILKRIPDERESWPRSWYLTRVEYNRQTQEREIREGLDEVFTWLEKWWTTPSNLTYRLMANAALNDILEYSITRYKADAFESERESRYVYRHVGILTTTAAEPPTQVRTSGTGELIPYVCLSTASGEGIAKLPIAKVYFGPRLHPSLTRKALKIALDRYGYSDVQTEGAGFTLRG